MGAPRISEAQKAHYMRLREMGLTQKLAASGAGVSEGWGKGFERDLRNSSGAEWRAAREGRRFRGPVPVGELGVEARRSLEDFELFRRRYMGFISTAWQVETAELIVGALATGVDEFLVVNCPPGSGKTALLRHVAAWVTVRDRRVRGLFGSRIENNARRQLRALRRILERPTPVKAPSELLDRGLAVDAEACLAADFGSFKPLTSDIWKADEFVVAQVGDESVDEKEPTWSCYGQDSGVLGNRFNLILWDDVVDKTTIRTLEAQEAQRQWWDEEAETRLESGGVLMLVGQRMAASDLYRYCLDKRVEPDELDEEEDAGVGVSGEPGEPIPQYRHIVYRAHYEELCVGAAGHRAGAASYPEGCLLDPFRLGWSKLRQVFGPKPRTYSVQYQQGDAQPDGVLVPELWISGGVEVESGQLRPGCWDEWRDLCELPEGLIGPLYSSASVDPSGKKMWAVQWWVDAPNASNQSFLMDLERKAMPANQLLDWDANRQVFYGLMEEWQARSVALGWPIAVWVVEVNAAQRYLLAYDHVRRWQAKWGVSILPHTTGPRKLDEDHGPWIMRDRFKHGQVRLPGKQGVTCRARIQSLKLVDEVTRWPNPGYDDEVMAAWFHFLHLPQLTMPAAPEGKRWRPSWLRASA